MKRILQPYACKTRSGILGAIPEGFHNLQAIWSVYETGHGGQHPAYRKVSQCHSIRSHSGMNCGRGRSSPSFRCFRLIAIRGCALLEDTEMIVEACLRAYSPAGDRSIRLLMIFARLAEVATRYVSSSHAKLRARNGTSKQNTLLLSITNNVYSKALNQVRRFLSIEHSQFNRVASPILHIHLVIFHPHPLPFCRRHQLKALRFAHLQFHFLICFCNRLLLFSLSHSCFSNHLASRHGSYRRNGNLCGAPCIFRHHTSPAKKTSVEHKDIQSSEMATQISITCASEFSNSNRH